MYLNFVRNYNYIYIFQSKLQLSLFLNINIKLVQRMPCSALVDDAIYGSLTS